MTIKEQIFVGRQEELKQFDRILRSPEGQAVLVIGPQGMGKSSLVKKMAKCAADHPLLKCGFVAYEVAESDSVDTIMELMLEDVYEAANKQEGSFAPTKHRIEQWRALLNVIKIGDLVMSSKRDPQGNTRKQFLDRLALISEMLPDEGRALFVIDSDKYMNPQSANAWRNVVKQLPRKIKFLFAQRPEDALASNHEFNTLEKVVRIPQADLDVLDDDAIEEMLLVREDKISYDINELRNAISHYQGHPYFITAALNLLEDGLPIEELPSDPTKEKIVEAQLKRIHKYGGDAIRLFETYTVLEVPVPYEVVEAVSDLDPPTRKHLLGIPYLNSLLNEDGDGRKIYHSLISDHILDQLSKKETKKYHQNTVDVYRRLLNEKNKPNELAARRLSEHVLESEGTTAFVDSFVSECFPSLLTLGFLETAEGLSHRALQHITPGSLEEAVIRGNLGIIHKTRGDLEKAEDMYNKSLAINEELGYKEGMANTYGNLGNIYQTRGDLDNAEEMYNKSLTINKELGRKEDMAGDYSNLGIIYKNRGDLEKAEEMHNKALSIHKELGHKEGMACTYGNLGIIYYIRGDLEQAEEMHNKALSIHKELGRKEGMACDYSNLGIIYQDREDLEKAGEMHNKSLTINKKLGRKEGMASNYGNLGIIYDMREVSEKAEEMYNKALTINKELGRKEGMAIQYGNLGIIYKDRGGLEKTIEFWNRALKLYNEIGMPHMVEKIQDWLDGLSEEE